MKILFACGGTAGHINPALATANYIRSRYPDTQVLFIGSPKGMEARLVPEAGYDFAPVELKGIQRRLSWHNFCYNLSSMELLCTWLGQDPPHSASVPARCGGGNRRLCQRAGPAAGSPDGIQDGHP